MGGNFFCTNGVPELERELKYKEYSNKRKITMQWKGMKTGLTTIRENFTRYTIFGRVGHVVLEKFSILQLLRLLEIGMSKKHHTKEKPLK